MFCKQINSNTRVRLRRHATAVTEVSSADDVIYPSTVKVDSPEQSPASSSKLKNHLKKLNRKLAEKYLPKDFTCFMACT